MIRTALLLLVALAMSTLSCGSADLDPPFGASSSLPDKGDADSDGGRVYFDSSTRAVASDAPKARDAGTAFSPDAASIVDAAHSDANLGDGANPDASKAEGGSDAGDEKGAPLPVESCARVRACWRNTPALYESCLESATPAARARAQALLSCELQPCSAPCQNSGASEDDCVRCLLNTCQQALENCVRTSGCGDGKVDPQTEACDDGNDVETDDCTSACTEARCGDGIVHAGVEACDDGNLADDDGCLSSCDRPICSEDEVWRSNAGCEPNEAPLDACGAACTVEACGNGVLEGAEECDDGNQDPFDGCSNACAASADHLLLSEVVSRPAGAEMIEIYNPTPEAIDLSNYALSDSAAYVDARASGFSTASGSDFAAQFPAGASIGPHEYRCVAVGNASGGSTGYEQTYGMKPDFEIRPAANGATDDPLVSNMRSTQTKSSLGALASLTDAGEPVVLFLLLADGRVADVDYVFFGAESSANPPVDKTGVVANGVSYLPDTPGTGQSKVGAPPEGGALHRCVYSESGETVSGGNGVTGHDETSEPWLVTFAVATSAFGRTPGGPPPAGLCPP